VPKILNPQDIADFRERLCDVAERLFAEKGPDAVTVRELAGELGVSPMTPYRYFTDKDAMLAAVRTRAFDRFADAMETASRSAGSASDLGRAYAAFAFEHPAAYRLMFDVTQPTVAQHADLGRAMARARGTMSLGPTSLASRGLIAAEDVELISHVMWSALHGPIMLQMAGALDRGPDAAAIIERSISLLGKGLAGGLAVRAD